jgi:hypothetical protein
MKPFRPALAASFVFSLVLAILWLARSTAAEPLSPFGLAVLVLGAPACVLLLGAVYEWLVHRYVYHRPSRLRLLQAIHEIHARGHHWHRFPPNRYVAAGPVERIPVYPPDPFALCRTVPRRALAWVAQYALYLSVAVPFAFAPIWLLSRNLPFTVSFVIVSLAVCWLFIKVHDLIHYPSGHFIGRLRAFEFLDRHHYIHHVDNEVNVNFLLPLGDLLFGTLRTELTGHALAERWPKFEDAKALTPAAAPPAPAEVSYQLR